MAFKNIIIAGLLATGAAAAPALDTRQGIWHPETCDDVQNYIDCINLSPAGFVCMVPYPPVQGLCSGYCGECCNGGSLNSCATFGIDD